MHFFVSVTPPTLYFDLPTKVVKNTFVGFVLPNENNEDCFFETLIAELKREHDNVLEMSCKQRSFQEIFQAVKEQLKGRVEIDKIDDFGGNPIYLFNNKRLVKISILVKKLSLGVSLCLDCVSIKTLDLDTVKK
jgi:hypothetical protein